ncbi:MAG: hypothetical protein L0227_12400 [Chloroflexi bacterium]|nr:hypothetical protein [Chloroflexota bacterium]
MGPQDRLGALLDGMGCTVCEEHVPGARIRLLARRDDLLFLQLDCPSCGSTSLGFVADGEVSPGGGVAAEAARLADATPISSDDVLDMHAFLDSWTGDLGGLLGPGGAVRRVAAVGHAGPARRAGGPASHRSGRSA